MPNAAERLRSDATEILQACLNAADPETAVKNRLHVRDGRLAVFPDVQLDLNELDRIFVVGAGKGSAPMAKAVEDILGDRLEGGIICVKYGHGLALGRVEVMEGGHPVPDRAGEQAARRIVDLLRELGPRDLVIACISGGGSALLPGPVDGVTLEEKQDLTNLLLTVGANIHEINAVRKHLSLTKGGNLMRLAYPAVVVNFMLSDVVGDAPDTIASGPFAPDRSTFREALSVIENYGLAHKVAQAVVRRFRAGAEGRIPETPKQGDEIFRRVRNVIVGSNFLSLKAGERRAEELGYVTVLLSSSVEGDTREAALFHAAVAREVRSTGNPAQAPACILSGGETTVVLTGDGKGGRNQHFALSLVEVAATIPRTLFLSAGTDGTDGPTDAAGAVVDDKTLDRSRALGLDANSYLRSNDSYNFFRPLGDLVVTGPTRTNVMDVRMILVAE